jgi:hypothetical protein
MFKANHSLPWIGQVIWIAFIMAIYIRLILVITRKEELLEELDPRRETTKCSAWSDSPILIELGLCALMLIQESASKSSRRFLKNAALPRRTKPTD